MALEADRVVPNLVAREGFTRASGQFDLTFWGNLEPYLPDAHIVPGDPELVKDPDETPLMRAAEQHDSKLVSGLIRGGAEVNARDQIGRTALMFALGDCWNDVIVEVGPAGDTVKVLLAAGADVNVRNKHGETPLMLAASCGEAEIVEALIGHGADVNARTRNGYSALSYSAHSRDTRARGRIMAMLKKAGAKY